MLRGHFFLFQSEHFYQKWESKGYYSRKKNGIPLRHKFLFKDPKKGLFFMNVFSFSLQNEDASSSSCFIKAKD